MNTEVFISEVGMSKELTTGNSQPVMIHQELVAKAIEHNSMDALERLMALQEQWEAKQAKKAFYDALSDFQSECPVIIKNKQGHNYKYAPLEDVIAQTGPLIAKHGLSYRWEQGRSEHGAIEITCVVTHRDGHSERLSMSGDADCTGSKNSIQAIGSTVTYLKRYSFLGSFGIATADDDIDGRIGSFVGELISFDQATEIKKMIKDSDSDEGALLNWLKVDSVEDIPSAKYKTVIDAIKQKSKRMGASKNV